MDQQLDDYLLAQINKILATPSFANLPEEQKQQTQTKLKDYFYQLILETMIDRLSDEQVMELKDLDFNSPEAEQKIEEVATKIPGLIFDIEEKIDAEVDKIFQSGNLPN